MLCSSKNKFVEFVSNRQLKETNGYCVIFKINVIEELEKKLERNYRMIFVILEICHSSSSSK